MEEFVGTRDGDYYPGVGDGSLWCRAGNVDDFGFAADSNIRPVDWDGFRGGVREPKCWQSKSVVVADDAALARDVVPRLRVVAEDVVGVLRAPVDRPGPAGAVAAEPAGRTATTRWAPRMVAAASMHLAIELRIRSRMEASF